MRTKGDRYEAEAAAYLTDQGVRIIERNFASKTGEIDIIGQQGNCLIFIEVRVRKNPGYAGAAASVDRRKQQRIVRTAQYFLQVYPHWANNPCRFDVIAFEPRQSTYDVSANWIQSAFTA